MICLILLVTAISVGLRAYFREPVSDDLLYRYILDENPLGDNNYSVLVQGFGDAIRSQSIQYFYSNGRTLIHVLVQMFAGPWGFTAFAIFLGILIAVVEILFVRYSIPKSQQSNPLIWILVSITYLYLFQNNSGTWYSIAGGMNYLLPMMFVLGFLLIFQHLNEARTKPNLLAIILLSLFGFITGWCQECFSVPLSGGLFFLILCNLRKTKTSIWVLAIFLWIGTAILVFAPGNFVRLGSGSGLTSSIINGVKLLIGTRLFWIMLIGLLSLCVFSKSKFKEFLRHNRFELLILSIALIFGLIANTLPQSFTGISFFSAIILFKLTCYLPDTSKKFALSCAISSICILLVCVHQYRIICVTHKTQNINHAFVEEYISSPNGIMAIPDIEIPTDVKPFVKGWFNITTTGWQMLTLNKHYFKGEKEITLLDKDDYLAYKDPILYLSTHKPIDNFNDIYQGENIIWFNGNNIPVEGDTIYIKVEPFKHSAPAQLFRKLTNANIPDNDTQEIVVSQLNIIKTNSNLTGIKFGSRKIQDIEIHKYGENEENLDTCTNVQ